MEAATSAWAVFRAFAHLGVTAFGGPVAHLAHFRRELVVRRGWLSEAAYGELVAFAQFLPGPTSSQVGFLLGWRRAGLSGALAAWCGFTLPSAIVLAALAVVCAGAVAGGAWQAGMEAAVLAVVAHAVLGMARMLCPDAPRATIAAGVAAACLLVAVPWAGVAALALAGLAGVLAVRPAAVASAGDGPSPSLRVSLACLAAAALVVAAAIAVGAVGGTWGVLFATHVLAGTLVFGGGHVVLPLLHDPLVGGGLIGGDAFLAGYGLAQAVPGPLFTVAAWTGGIVAGPGGAALAVVAIFAPGLLLALGLWRFYRGALSAPWARRAVAGLNAGVVGLLGAALWHPVGSAAVHGPGSLALALAAFTALAAWNAPAWAVVAGTGGLAMAAAAWR